MSIDIDDMEAWIDVPELYVTGDPPIKIGIAAHGGGTVGRAYGNNGWDYVVTVDGEPIIEGSDLRSGMPATHEDMAKTLCVFLCAAGESLKYNNAMSEYASEYDEQQRLFLIDQYERFSIYGIEEEE
jgi:hypothetical protein